MAKPTENKEDKNLNKKASEIDTTTLIVLSNIIVIVVVIAFMVALYFLLDTSFEKKLKNLAPAQEETLDEEEFVEIMKKVEDGRVSHENI